MRFAAAVSICLLILALGNSNCAAAEATYNITHVYSSVTFSIKKFFFTQEGGFRDYGGEIVFDRDHPERSHVKMIVQAASIDTRNNHRDEVLRSDDFFDVRRYPTLQFVSTRVTPTKPGEAEVAGELTIHGITRHIVVQVHYLGEKKLKGWGDFAGFETEFTIDRTEFGVNGTRWAGGTPVLSPEVTIHLVIGGTASASR